MTPDFGDQSGADDGAGIGIGAVVAGAVLGAEVTGHAAHHLKKDSTGLGVVSAGAGYQVSKKNLANRFNKVHHWL